MIILFVFLLVLFIFSVFKHYFSFFYSSSSHYIFLIFSNTFSWYWYQSKNIHSFFCIEYSNFHEFTNPRIFQMQNVSFFLFFFYFHFSSLFHFCKMSYWQYWHYYLFHCVLSVGISVILFLFCVFFIYSICFCSQSCLIIKEKKAIRGSCLEFFSMTLQS